MKRELDTEQLDEAIARLPREIMPGRDLWAGVEQGLSERIDTARAQGSSPRQRWAAVLVLSLAGLLGWRLMLLPQAPETVSPEGPQISQEASGQPDAPVSGEAVLMASYEAQKADWLAGIGAISEPFDNWQQQLAVWDEAITQVRTGLDYYPDEPVLLSQMESLYQQQMNYLQLVSAAETAYY